MRQKIHQILFSWGLLQKIFKTLFFMVFSISAYASDEASIFAKLLLSPISGSDCCKEIGAQGLVYEDFKESLAILAQDSGQMGRVLAILNYFEGKNESSYYQDQSHSIMSGESSYYQDPSKNSPLRLDREEMSELQKKRPNIPKINFCDVHSPYKKEKKKSPRFSLHALVSPRKRSDSIKKIKNLESPRIDRRFIMIEKITYSIQKLNYEECLKILIIDDETNLISYEDIQYIAIFSSEQSFLKQSILKIFHKRTNLRTIYKSFDKRTEQSKCMIENVIKGSDLTQDDLKELKKISSEKQRSKRLIKFAMEKIAQKDDQKIQTRISQKQKRLSFGSQLFTSRIKSIEDINKKKMSQESIKDLISYLSIEYKKNLLTLNTENIELWIEPGNHEYQKYRDFCNYVFEFFLNKIQNTEDIYSNVLIGNIIDILDISISVGHTAFASDLISAVNGSKFSNDFWKRWEEKGYDIKNVFDIKRFVKGQYKTLLFALSAGEPISGILPFEVFYEEFKQKTEGFLTENSIDSISLKDEALNEITRVLENLKNSASFLSGEIKEDNPFLNLFSDYKFDFNPKNSDDIL